MSIPSLRRAARRLLKGQVLPPIVRAVRSHALTYLDEDALADLHALVRTVESERRPGVIIEAGCALGGSAIVLADAKVPERPLYVYDVFGMIPPPSDADGEDVHARYRNIKSGESEGLSGRKYYGYEEDLLGIVTSNFQRHGVSPADRNVHFVQGLFSDTLHPSEPVAVAHIDGDWFESVKTCLERITPHLVPGGVLVIDDYDHWSGCRRAVDGFFSSRRDDFDFVRRSRLHIVRRDAR